MMDFERLSKATSDELERAVLRSAERDRPPPGNRERFLASLGLGVGVAAAAGPAAGVAAGTAAEVALKTTGFAIIAKWVGIGAVAGLVSGGIAMQVSERPAAPLPKVSFAPVVPARVHAAPTANARERSRVPEPDPRPTELPSRQTQSAPQASTVRAVDEEVAALDRARNALRSGENASALRELQEHARRFPSGVLVPEAEVLRIEALTHEDPKAASALARAFLQSNPQSPHANRVRMLAERVAAEERSENPAARPAAAPSE